MVSTRRYFRVFLDTMVQRGKALNRSLSRKRKLDDKNERRATISRMREVLALIGKDALFIKAEHRNKKTIRHISLTGKKRHG